MPNLTEIQSKPGTTLDDLEMEIVRQIIGVSGAADSANYQDSRTRMLALPSEQNKIVRVLIDQYLQDSAFDTTEIAGGSDGMNYSAQRDKQTIAAELERIVYGLEPNNEDNVSSGSIKMIPVTYSTGSPDFD